MVGTIEIGKLANFVIWNTEDSFTVCLLYTIILLFYYIIILLSYYIIILLYCYYTIIHCLIILLYYYTIDDMVGTIEIKLICKVTREMLKMKNTITPYLDRTLYGKVQSTILRGIF
jgi:hypothetical protein